MANENILVDLILNDKDFKKGLKTATKDTQDLGKKGGQSFNQLSGGLKKLGGVVAAVFATDQLISFGKEVINTTAKFQTLQATLKTALGSNSAAQLAFQQIQKFAASTPFQVDELTESYLRLAQRGIRATNEQLTKLGDFAAASGKSMSQLTEAILDVNNPERWKEFGVKVSTSGDQVTGSFMGMEMQFERTTQGAVKMIEAFGAAEGIAGGMAAVSETLGGKISNLSDSWDSLLYTIGEGNNTVMMNSINMMASMVNAITELFQSYKQLKQQKMGDEAAKLNQELGKLTTVEDYKKAIDKLNEGLVKTKEEHQKVAESIADNDNATSAFLKPLQELTDKLGLTESKAKELQENFIDSSGKVMAYSALIADLTNQMNNLANVTNKNALETKEYADEVDKLNKKIETFLSKVKDEHLIEISTNTGNLSGSFTEIHSGLNQTDAGVGGEFPVPPVEDLGPAYEQWMEMQKGVNEQLSAGDIFAMDFTSNMVDGLFEAIAAGENFGEVMGDVIKSLIRDIIKMIVKLVIMNALFPGAGAAASMGGGLIGSLFGRNASGTNNFGGGLSLVGEYGPEIVSMPRGASVSSAGRTGSMMGGGELTGKLRGSDIIITSSRASTNRMR